MERSLKILLATLLIFVAFTSTAFAGEYYYYGGWYYADNPGGSEDLVLGDGQSDGLYLGGSPRYCGKPGASYAEMRRIMHRNNNRWIDWTIANSCRGGYVRVCIENRYGEHACSTYESLGWHYFEQ